MPPLKRKSVSNAQGCVISSLRSASFPRAAQCHQHVPLRLVEKNWRLPAKYGFAARGFAHLRCMQKQMPTIKTQKRQQRTGLCDFLVTFSALPARPAIPAGAFALNGGRGRLGGLRQSGGFRLYVCLLQSFQMGPQVWWASSPKSCHASNVLKPVPFFRQGEDDAGPAS